MWFYLISKTPYSLQTRKTLTSPLQRTLNSTIISSYLWALDRLSPKLLIPPRYSFPLFHRIWFWALKFFLVLCIRYLCLYPVLTCFLGCCRECITTCVSYHCYLLMFYLVSLNTVPFSYVTSAMQGSGRHCRVLCKYPTSVMYPGVIYSEPSYFFLRALEGTRELPNWQLILLSQQWAPMYHQIQAKTCLA